MALYYVNKNAQDNGDHEVHKNDCSYLPSAENQQYLRSYTNCRDVVAEAKKYYDQVNGCFFCANACHTA